MSVTALLATLPTRTFYLVDTGLGRLTGSRCPNCGARGNNVVHKHLWVNVLRCTGCGLLFRPTGFREGRALAFYYSVLYRDAGVATQTALLEDPAALARMIESEGKDRSAIIRKIAETNHIERPRICVVGCSWGYEIVRLKEAGFDAVGIELSEPRRALAKERLGLSVFASEDEIEGPIDIVMSSHVLEHIPRISARLDAIDRALRPRVHVHTTPTVDEMIEIQTVIGREHPLGVTADFWRGYASDRGFSKVSFETVPGEMITTLVR